MMVVFNSSFFICISFECSSRSRVFSRKILAELLRIRRTKSKARKKIFINANQEEELSIFVLK